MSIEKINQAKAEIASTSAYKTITEFFDADSFCEIDALQNQEKVQPKLLQVLVRSRVCLYMLLLRTATFAAEQ